MKIVHICLSGPVTDGWNYQDNLLSKYHRRLGFEVSLIASKWIWSTKGEIIKSDESEYVNSDGVKMIRLDIKNDKPITYKFRKFIGLYDTLENEQPDILFIHGVAFLDINILVDYLRKHDAVRAYADNHSDFSNSATNWVSKNILHKIIWKHYAQKLVPYVTKFYGVLPARVDFLTDVYKLPKDKCELLVMGADDDKIQEMKKTEAGKQIRNRYGITDEEFLIVTGGKIDPWKAQTLLLMEAMQGLMNVNLLIFGSVDESMKDKFNRLCENQNIIYIGWINAQDSYTYFDAADLVVFPGRHSVFWEQAAGQGKPMICKYWDGTTHVDLGGNVEFLYKDSTEEIRQAIQRLVSADGKRTDKYYSMKKCAAEKGPDVFSYKKIADRSIECC